MSNRPAVEPAAASVWKVVVSAHQPGEQLLERSDGPPLRVHAARLYFLRGPLNQQQVCDVCTRLLCDPVAEQFEILAAGQPETVHAACIEVLPRPGVMDPAAASACQAMRELGLAVEEVRTGRRYSFEDAAAADLPLLARRLANPLIEQVECRPPGDRRPAADPFVSSRPASPDVRTVDLRAADADQLRALSREGHLFLDLDEMQAIQAHYRALERAPTDIELETLAQTWSEHCVHKTLKSAVVYHGAGFPEIIDLAGGGGEPGPHIERRYGNLLAETIMAATRRLDRPWCWSVFSDNAGIIAFDDKWGVAFKVETHNHPSALEPYGGAATGIGGCIRDILGCGLGARPFASTDVFCFAGPDLPEERVPAGLFHPRRSLREVVRGVRDYGNRMGIPTVNGALCFDDRYLGNPLVFCGCVGLIPRQHINKEVRSGDRVVVIGGRTGRDGIHGATFSSGAMSGTHTAEFAHAVQIGNAITEKKVLDVLLQARDAPGGPLYRSVTDCGAGGLSSAVGELGRDLGAEVQLERVPLKYDGLRYDEIWISEAQERMVLAVPPDNVPALTDLCRREDVEATDIGRFTDDGRLLLRHGGCTVGDLDMEFLHEGRPRRQRQASWEPPRRESPPQRVPAPAAPAAPRTPDEWRAELLRQLTLPDIASKEWIIRQYDHEVQAGSVIKPLMGPGGGPTDGAVIRPVLGSDRGVALSCGLCPGLSDIDPYVMAVAAIDEAVRNNLCVGGDIGRMALLDNFCWGGVSQPQELGGLVRAAQGCHDAALVYGLPFISGKDSLNNVFDMSADEARRRGWPAQLAIPGTLLISAISVVADVRCCRSSNLKQPGNRLLWLRPMGAARRGRRGRTGGAGQDGWSLATLGAAAAAASRLFNEVAGIRAVHDISEGGLLVAAAEMAIGSRAGLRLDGPLDDGELLRRGLGSYLVEASPGQVPGAVEFAEDALQILDIGEVLEVPRMELIRPGQAPVVWSCDELRSAWRSTFSNG